MSHGRFYTPSEQFKDGAGHPYAFGKLYFYASGTSSPLDTYANAALTILNPNPVTLDAAGRAGNVFLKNQRLYKVVLCNADGDQVWTRDPIGRKNAVVTSAGGNMGGTINFTMGAPIEATNITPPTPPDILAKDWRIYVTHTGGPTVTDGYLLLGSVEFRSVIGGPNVATGGTATASSTDGSSATITSIIGANTNNAPWLSDRVSTPSPPYWIRYSWPSAVNIKEIALGFPQETFAASFAFDYLHAPLTFALQYSLDAGGSWTTYYAWDLSPSGWVPYSSVVSRFAVNYSPTWYRVYITAPAPTGSAYQFKSAQIRETHGGSNAAAGAFCSQSTYQSYIPTDFSVASGCFGQATLNAPYWADSGYGWLSEQNPTLPQWMSVGFCFPVDPMTEMQLEVIDNAVLGFFANRYPTDFTIDKSTDFSAWSNLYTASVVSWVSSTPQDFSW